MFYRFLVMCLCVGFSAPVLASEKLIKDRLAELVANPELAVIEATPIADLYQIMVEGQVIYMTVDGRYLFSGDLVDLKTRSNLTEKAKVNLVKMKLEKLDTESMIIYSATGKTEHIITVFTDIDCPFCSKLHSEIPALNENGVEVRYLAYPRAGIGSASYHKAVSVWCADNRAKTMDKAMWGEDIAAKTCHNPVASHIELSQGFNVRGTPNIFLEDGQVLPGYVPAKELLRVLNKK